VDRVTPLYAIHGLESHGGWFAPLAHELAAQDVELVALERTPRDRARSPDDWLDSMSMPEGAAILAHSWGAKLATYAVLQGRLRPRALVLVNPGFRAQPDIARASSWPVHGEHVRIPIDDERYTAERAVAHLIATDERRLRSVTRGFLAADRRMTRAIQAGPVVSVPTFVLTSGRDGIVDETANESELARLFPRRESTCYGDRGHLLVLEAPALIASPIAAWLRKQ
jgi:pimeloyl-ACP methyl ester carboxylesterase